MKLGKEYKIGFIFMAVCYLALGVVLLFYSDLSRQMLCYLLGAITVVYGLVHIVTYFARTEFEEVYRLDLTTGIVMTAAGLYVILQAEKMASILHIVVGCAILLDSLIKLQNAIDLKRLGSHIWGSVLVLSVFCAVLGLVLILRVNYKWLSALQYLGLCLIVDGCVNVWSFLFLSINLNRLRKAKRAALEAVCTPAAEGTADAPESAETAARATAQAPNDDAAVLDGTPPESLAAANASATLAPQGAQVPLSFSSAANGAAVEAGLAEAPHTAPKRKRLAEIFRPPEDDEAEIAGSIRLALAGHRHKNAVESIEAPASQPGEIDAATEPALAASAQIGTSTDAVQPEAYANFTAPVPPVLNAAAGASFLPDGSVQNSAANLPASPEAPSNRSALPDEGEISALGKKDLL